MGIAGQKNEKDTEFATPDIEARAKRPDPERETAIVWVRVGSPPVSASDPGQGEFREEEFPCANGPLSALT
ncbi:hypothetical protein GCM10023166_32310 [Paeniglutamicibacter cryotolerans]